MHTILARVKTPQPPTHWRSPRLGPLSTTGRPWSPEMWCWQKAGNSEKKTEKPTVGDVQNANHGKLQGEQMEWSKAAGHVMNEISSSLKSRKNSWSCGAQSRGTLCVCPSGSGSLSQPKKSWLFESSTNSKKSWLLDSSKKLKKSWLFDSSKKPWLSLKKPKKSWFLDSASVDESFFLALQVFPHGEPSVEATYLESRQVFFSVALLEQHTLETQILLLQRLSSWQHLWKAWLPKMQQQLQLLNRSQNRCCHRNLASCQVVMMQYSSPLSEISDWPCIWPFCFPCSYFKLQFGPNQEPAKLATQRSVQRWMSQSTG